MLINLFLDYIVYITSSAAIGISTEIYQHAFNSLQGAIIDRDNFFTLQDFDSLVDTPEAIQIVDNVRAVEDLYHSYLRSGTISVSTLDPIIYDNYVNAHNFFVEHVSALRDNTLENALLDSDSTLEDQIASNPQDLSPPDKFGPLSIITDSVALSKM
jgi:hypothetical protein